MGAPIFKTLTHPTKPPLELVSNDDGKTWEPSAPTDDGSEPFSVPASLGVTDGPVPKVPVKPSRAQPPDPAAPPAKPSAPPSNDDPVAALKSRHAEEVERRKAFQAPPEKMKPLAAFQTMLPQSMSFSLSDEMEGVGAQMRARDEEVAGTAAPQARERGMDDRSLPDYAVLKNPREVEDSAYQGAHAPRQAQIDKAQADQPGVSMATQIGGGALASLPLAAFGMPATMLGRMGVGMAEGAALGGAESAGAAHEGERMEKGLVGLGVGGLTGGAVGALPLDTMAQWLGRKGRELTGKAAGPTAGQLKRRATEGRDLTRAEAYEELGGEIQEEGFNAGWTPGSANRIEANARDAKAQAGQQIDEIVDEMMSVGRPEPQGRNPTGGFDGEDLGPRSPQRLTDGPDPAQRPFTPAAGPRGEPPAPQSAGDLPANAGAGVHTPPTSEWHHLNQKLRPERFGPRSGLDQPPPKQLPPPPAFDESGYPLSKSHQSDVSMNDVGAPPKVDEPFVGGSTPARPGGQEPEDVFVWSSKPDPVRAVEVNLGFVGKEVQKAANEMRALRTPKAEKLAAELEDQAEMFRTTGPDNSGYTDYKTAWKTRVLLDKFSHNAAGQMDGVGAEQLRMVAGKVQKALEVAVGRNRPELLDPLLKANKTYGRASDAFSIAGDRVGSREAGDAEYLKTVGNLAGLGAFNRYGHSAMAAGADNTRKSLAAFPGAMGYLGAQMYPQDNPELFEEE